MSKKSPKLSVIELENGEFVSLSAIEITTVPDISIIGETSTQNTVLQKDYNEEYKVDFANLLSEVFQHYKLSSNSGDNKQDISLEILWTTSPASNQAYQANISIFIVLRVIDSDQTSLQTSLNNIHNICTSTLNLQRYEFKQVTADRIKTVLGGISQDEIKVLVKDEHVAVLQNQILNECYTFDRFPETTQDLSKIVNVLIDTPDCCVSFQLIPTTYEPYEVDTLDKMTNILETLNKGVQDHIMGNVGFALAEKHAELYKYYSKHKTSALFLYNIIISGTSQAVNKVSTRVYGQINGGSGPSSVAKFVDVSQDIDMVQMLYPLPWVLNEILLNKDRDVKIWQQANGTFNNFYRLPYIISATEASEFFHLPIGSTRISAGLVINSSEKNSKQYASSIINGADIDVGELRSSSHGDQIGFFLKDLTKHMLVVGTPGSGKTTFLVSLLDRLWKEHGIPFLVIEPAKNEYRALIQSIPDLQVFTPGKSHISPFQVNPFVPPEGVRLENYKSTLKTAFAAAVTMSSPLDKIFEETIDNCYSDFRWLESYTVADKGKTFNIQDFIKCFQETFDAIGYVGEAKNIGRAGMVRLNGLTKLFDNYGTIPIKDILTKPTIIELAAIENSDEKALIIALLLLNILAYVNSNYLGEGELKNVILLEEAHVLLDSDSPKQEGAADPSSIAKGLLKRMLAEIRSYGVGLVVADQSPRKVGTDVVALTNIKLSFRLVETEDKQILADSTNMSDVHIQRLARLKPGEAMLFFDKLEEPEEVRTEDYRAANDIAISLTDEDIRDSSTYWNDKKDQLRPYPECDMIKYCQEACDTGCRSLAKEIAKRIVSRNFKPTDNKMEILKRVYKDIEKLTAAELNDEPFTPELGACVKMQVLRKIKYFTQLPISDKLIGSTLAKA